MSWESAEGAMHNDALGVGSHGTIFVPWALLLKNPRQKRHAVATHLPDLPTESFSRESFYQDRA